MKPPRLFLAHQNVCLHLFDKLDVSQTKRTLRPQNSISLINRKDYADINVHQAPRFDFLSLKINKSQGAKYTAGLPSAHLIKFPFLFPSGM